MSSAAVFMLRNCNLFFFKSSLASFLSVFFSYKTTDQLHAQYSHVSIEGRCHRCRWSEFGDLKTGGKKKKKEGGPSIWTFIFKFEDWLISG